MLITLQDAAAKLRAAEKILLTAHVNPDGDAIGSTLAMLQILHEMGKTAQIYIDDKIPRNFSVMPFEEEIRRPREDETFDADLLVVLDTSTDRIGEVAKLTSAPILNIDHHVTNKGGDFDLYVDADAAATCEIILQLARELGAKITTNIAVCLYTGIATDTGFFNYSNTRAKTLHAAAELVELGVEPNLISEQMERRSYNDLKVMSAALDTTKFFYGGKVAGMFIDEELARIVDTTEGLVDLIRVIDGVDVAFLLIFKGENIYRVSMRSKGVEVSDIARRLGGGGHVRAAGCTLYKSFDEAKRILIRTIGEFMIEQGYLRPAEYDNREEIALADFDANG